MVRVEESQLLTQLGFVFAPRSDPPTNRCHMLAQVQVETLHTTRVGFPAALGQDRLDGLCRTGDDAVFDPHDAPTPLGFDDLRREEPRLRHPTWHGPTPSALATLGWPPPTVVRDECGHVSRPAPEAGRFHDDHSASGQPPGITAPQTLGNVKSSRRDAPASGPSAKPPARCHPRVGAVLAASQVSTAQA